ncbi:hypothetical protein ABI59_05895 [Acidobacteria bacterium Mor1]|nr:hypothetical protein ABI59_05895 [Acidobacteria bacterium Mor1]
MLFSRSRPVAALVLGFVCVATALAGLPVVAGQVVDGQVGAGQLGESTGFEVRFERDPASGARVPASFHVRTPEGPLDGLVDIGESVSTLNAWHRLERIEVELVHRSADTPDGEVRVYVAGAGTVRYRLTRAGELELIGHDIADCSRLAESRVYRLLGTVLAQLEPALDAVTETEENAWRTLVFGWLRLARVLPSMVDDCRGVAPDAGGGRCVTHLFFDDCAACCGEGGRVDKAFAFVCGFTRMIRSPTKADVCNAIAFGVANCVYEFCEGKSGDPDPTRCGEHWDGICKNTCWTPGDERDDIDAACDVGHRCCVN